MEEFEDSMKTIDKAIYLIPKNADIWYHKGRILEKLRKNEEAINAFNTDLRIDNKDIKSWSAKGNLLLKLERYKEALEAYDEILKLDPDNTDAKQNKEVATKELKKQEFSSLINEIKSKFQNQDYSNVIELCDQARIIDVSNHLPDIYKGNSLYELKRYEEAIECYDKALYNDPQNADALNNKRKIVQELYNKKVETETLSQKEIREIKLLKTLEGDSYPIFSLAITPDNTKIVSGSRDETIKVLDLDTGKVLRTLKGHSYVILSVAITPDNTKIVSGSLIIQSRCGILKQERY